MPKHWEFWGMNQELGWVFGVNFVRNSNVSDDDCWE